MYKLIEKKGDKYLVLDTEDEVIDDFVWEELINLLQSGVISSCQKTENTYKTLLILAK